MRRSNIVILGFFSMGIVCSGCFGNGETQPLTAERIVILSNSHKVDSTITDQKTDQSVLATSVDTEILRSLSPVKSVKASDGFYEDRFQYKYSHRGGKSPFVVYISVAGKNLHYRFEERDYVGGQPDKFRKLVEPLFKQAAGKRS